MYTGKHHIEIGIQHICQLFCHSRQEHCNCTICFLRCTETISHCIFLQFTLITQIHKTFTFIFRIKNHLFPSVNSGWTHKIRIENRLLKHLITFFSPLLQHSLPDFCTCHTSFIFRNFHIKHKCNITKSFIHRILKIRGIFICIQQSYKQAGFCLLIIPDHSCFLINIRLFYPIEIICDFFYNFLKRTAILIRFKKFLCIKSTDLPGIIMLCKLHQQSVSYRCKPPAFFLKRNIFPRNPCSLVNTNLQFLYKCFIVFLHIQFLSCFENNTGRMP